MICIIILFVIIGILFVFGGEQFCDICCFVVIDWYVVCD